MKVKEIFIKKLEKAGYPLDVIYTDKSAGEFSFNDFLTILERDRMTVFKAIYGNGYMQNRGLKKIKEWEYRFGEALRDLENNYIKITMHYIIMQIKIGAVKL